MKIKSIDVNAVPKRSTAISDTVSSIAQLLKIEIVDVNAVRKRININGDTVSAITFLIFSKGGNLHESQKTTS